MMLDLKVLQQIGNMAVKDVQKKYPSVEIRFFALKSGDVGRVHIADKQDNGGRTGRLYDLEPLARAEVPVVKDIALQLSSSIERRVRDFLRLDEPASQA